MKLYNASGHPLYLYQGLDAKPKLGIYATMVPLVDRQVVDTGLSIGMEVLDEEFDVPLTIVKYRALMGMPTQKDGTGYIVSYEVAHAADALGRTDCFLAVDEVSAHQGAGIGFQKLGRLA